MMNVKSNNKMTGIGEIPVHWNLIPLKDVLTVMYGKNQSNVEVDNSDIPILGTGGIIGWSQKPLFNKESVLIGRKGTIDKPIYINIPFWTIDTLFYTDINKEKANIKFIYYLFQSIDWYKYNEATGVPSLSAKNISNILFACPTLQEQQKIAKILSIVDEQIEQTDQLIERTKELKNGFMQQLLTKGIGHTSFKKTDLGEIPDEWEIRKVNDIATVTTGNKDTKDKDDDGIYPFFVRSQKVESINSYSYDGESILTAGDGVGVGKVFHYINGKFDFHQRVYKISDFMNIEGKYLYYYFSHNFYNRAMKYNAKTSVDSVRRDMITQMEIPIPSASEQKKIISILFCIDEDIEGYQQEKAKYEELKKGLMQQLLTGKTRVKVD